MRDHADELCEGGAALAGIGCGSAAQAAALRRSMKLPFPLYADPGLESFEAAGLRREVVTVANPFLMARNAFRAFWSGARQTGVEGDPFQMGGTFVFAAGGELRYAHRSEMAGDHAPLEALRTALR